MIRKIVPFLQLMRLHQPTGIWLLLWPCWWSIAFASNKQIPEIYLLALFALGAIVMRGAGCTINDIIDKDIDAKVFRTRNRPLANGTLKLRHAYWLLLILLVLGLIVLIQLNPLSITIGILSFIPVLIYPFMKRIMDWPQLFLALTFNSGALIGWAAVANSIPIEAIALYGAGFFWTLGYDTIYAHQDKIYDKQVGIKSSAISMKENTKIYISVFYLTMILLLMAVGTMIFEDHNIIYYFSLILALSHLVWQIRTVDLDKPESCMRKFKSNGTFGWIVFLGILLEKLLG